MSTFRLSRSLLCVVCVLVLAPGCGPAEPVTYLLSGKVLLDGKPVESGSITFLPPTGQGSTAGAAIEQGTYHLSLLPGPFRVEIRSSEIVERRPRTGGGPGGDFDVITREIIPLQYNSQSQLTLEMPAKKTVHDFELKSK